MIIPFLKVWIVGAMIATLILISMWDAAKLILGYKKAIIEDPSRPWYKLPKEEWQEKEPTYMDAICFAAAWPLLLIDLVMVLCVVGIMRIVEKINGTRLS